MPVEILDPPVGEYFKPNSWAQWRFMVSEAPELLYSGRLGSSKSRTLTEKGCLYAHRFPGSRVILARRRRTDLGGTTLVTLLEQSITPAHKAWGWRPSADGGSALFFPRQPGATEPSQIICVGLDNPGKVLSGEYDLALVDQCEELTAEQWDTLGGRLRHQAGTYRQLAGACNPDGPAHFLYGRFSIERAFRLGGNGLVARNEHPLRLIDRTVIPAGALVTTEVILAGPTDNAENLTMDYLARLARFKGRYYERYVLGLWVAYEGTVYECWNEPLHVIERPEAWVRDWGGFPPPTWKRYRAIDFGYENPFVCQWWARSPEHRFYLYREIYHTHRTVNAHKAQMLAWESDELATLNRCLKAQGKDELKRLRINYSFADHDAEARAVLEDPFPRAIFTEPAAKEVTAGIQTVYEHMVPRRDPALGTVGCQLYIVRGARLETDDHLVHEGHPTCTAEEIPLYRFPKATKAANERAPDEKPQKTFDHGCDAMRYVLHTLRTMGDTSVVRLGSRP